MRFKNASKGVSPRGAVWTPETVSFQLKLNWIQPMRVGLMGWLSKVAVSAASLAS